MNTFNQYDVYLYKGRPVNFVGKSHEWSWRSLRSTEVYVFQYKDGEKEKFSLTEAQRSEVTKQ